MKVSVPYGKDGKLEAEIDEKRVLGLIEPNEVELAMKRRSFAEHWLILPDIKVCATPERCPGCFVHC